MTAWISYARASTDEQTTSCTQQHADNERAARIPPAATFDDEGVRGSVPVEDRAGFSRLIEFLKAAKAGTFVVRLYDTSRLGRFLDPEEHFVAERLLRKAGAREVAYTKGSYTTGRSMANSVLKAVESHANRAYSEKLSRDVHRGLMAAVREGKRTGGFAPYGYDLEYPDQAGRPYVRVRFVPVGGQRRAFEKHLTYLDDGKVRVIAPDHTFRPETKHRRSRLVAGDPKRIEAVRYIFEAYLGGRGMRAVAVELAERGFSSPEGNGWSTPGIRSILTNPVYTGRAVYGRRSESKYHRLEPGGVVRELTDGEVPQKHQSHVSDEHRWIVVENAHEAIVPIETWRAANEKRERRGANRMVVAGQARASMPYLLSGRMFCPTCKRNYVGSRVKSARGHVTPYYTCGTYARGGGCTRGGVREDEADVIVLKFVAEQLMIRTPEERLRSELRAAFKELSGPEPKVAKDPRPGELAQVEKEIAGIIANVSAENLSLFDARLSKLRSRRDTLRAAIAITSESAGAPAAPQIAVEAAVEVAMARARRFREAVASWSPAAVLAMREDLVPALVRRVIARPGDGVLEVEGYTEEELTAAALPPYVNVAGEAAGSDCRGSGRGDWI